MGKRDVTAASAPEVEAPADEAEESEPQPMPLPVRAAPAPAPAPEPRRKAPDKKVPEKKEPARQSITSLADLANIDMLMKSSAEMEGDEIPDIEAGPTSDLAPIVTDFDVSAMEGEEPEYAADEEGENFGDMEYDEEEEDEWGNTRKPLKPQKPQRKRERP